jgi:hypothetical protein
MATPVASGLEIPRASPRGSAPSVRPSDCPTPGCRASWRWGAIHASPQRRLGHFFRELKQWDSTTSSRDESYDEGLLTPAHQIHALLHNLEGDALGVRTARAIPQLDVHRVRPLRSRQRRSHGARRGRARRSVTGRCPEEADGPGFVTTAHPVPVRVGPVTSARMVARRLGCAFGEDSGPPLI